MGYEDASNGPPPIGKTVSKGIDQGVIRQTEAFGGRPALRAISDHPARSRTPQRPVYDRRSLASPASRALAAW
jgi:hypothetical protein